VEVQEENRKDTSQVFQQPANSGKFQKIQKLPTLAIQEKSEQTTSELNSEQSNRMATMLSLDTLWPTRQSSIPSTKNLNTALISSANSRLSFGFDWLCFIGSLSIVFCS
jgi:hypothetical protein